MHNATSSIMAGAFLDTLWRGECSCFEGSMFNPLQTMMALAIDPESDDNFGAEKMARAVGVPENWFTAENLVAPVDKAITALGKATLIYLSSQRALALTERIGETSHEDVLRAPETFAAVLAMHERLKDAGTLPASPCEAV